MARTSLTTKLAQVCELQPQACRSGCIIAVLPEISQIQCRCTIRGPASLEWQASIVRAGSSACRPAPGIDVVLSSTAGLALGDPIWTVPWWVQAMADRLTDIVCDAVLTIRKPDEPIDLYMVSMPEICNVHHASWRLWVAQGYPQE